MPQRSSRRAAPGRGRNKRVAIGRTLSGRIISFANLVGSPVLDARGQRIGRLDDVVVRWDSGESRPSVVSILVRKGRVVASLLATDVTIERNKVRLRSSALAVALPIRQDNLIALARDLLDHQLVDVEGVQVVRASDVYLADEDSSWHVAGVDVGQWTFWRRILPRRRTSPLPSRAIDWTDVQAFVPRFVDSEARYESAPAASAGETGSNLRLLHPAAQLHELSARDVADLVAKLPRDQQRQLSSLVDHVTAAEALLQVDAKRLAAVLADLDPTRRALIEAILLEGKS